MDDLKARANRQLAEIKDGDWFCWFRAFLLEKVVGYSRRLRFAQDWEEVLRLQAELAAYEEILVCLESSEQQ